jgi:hypothetical protein
MASVKTAHDDLESLGFREEVKLDAQRIGLRSEIQIDPISGYTTPFVGRFGRSLPAP